MIPITHIHDIYLYKPNNFFTKRSTGFVGKREQMQSFVVHLVIARGFSESGCLHNGLVDALDEHPVACGNPVHLNLVPTTPGRLCQDKVAKQSQCSVSCHHKAGSVKTKWLNKVSVQCRVITRQAMSRQSG